MKDNWVLIVVGSVVVGFVSGCVTDLAGGKPRVPLSDKNGSERIFSANEIETAAAITNALGNFRYRDLMLYEAAKSDWAYIVRGWHPTNGFVLAPILNASGSITNVPIDRAGKKRVPYVGYFHILVAPVATNQTVVTVRTVLSEVIDGKEISVHGGWANHYRKVPPIRQEEQDVLLAIAEELSGAKGEK